MSVTKIIVVPPCDTYGDILFTNNKGQVNFVFRLSPFQIKKKKWKK